MFIYATGDLLKSSADALVNTVNCEGFMGKGIAYQFKLAYPNNFKDYQSVCKKGELYPGKLHYFTENEKIIINFPTKNKWRNPSKIEYIESGLDALVPLIHSLSIKSIAIPPLGSGNGRLIWAQVRKLIEQKLFDTSRTVDIFLYEPSKSYVTRPVQEPKLSTSALVLMEIKLKLSSFSSIRLQKTAYFMNVFSHTNYFKFEKGKFGPYSHGIDVISHNIQAYQSFHGKSTKDAREILYRRLVSESVDGKLEKLLPAIQKACDFANEFPDDHELECLATVCYLIETGQAISDEAVTSAFLGWSKEKAKRFRPIEISEALKILCEDGIVDKNLEGYYLV